MPDEKGRRKFRKEDLSGTDKIFTTRPSADWLNDVQEEIISVIENAGKKPEIGKLQLLDSIQTLIGAVTATAKASATQSANEYSNSQNNKLANDLNGKISAAKASATQSANDLNGKISAAKASATQSANEYSNSQNHKLSNDLSGKISTAKAAATQAANEYSNNQNNKLAHDLNGKISAAKAGATQSANEYSNSQNNKLAKELQGKIKKLEARDSKLGGHINHLRKMVDSLAATLSRQITSTNTNLQNLSNNSKKSISLIKGWDTNYAHNMYVESYWKQKREERSNDDDDWEPRILRD